MVEKSILMIELEKARKRLVELEPRVQELRDRIEYAVKNRFSAVKAVADAQLKRAERLHAELKLLISELEKATGALPLGDECIADMSGHERQERRDEDISGLYEED